MQLDTIYARTRGLQLRGIEVIASRSIRQPQHYGKHGAITPFTTRNKPANYKSIICSTKLLHRLKPSRNLVQEGVLPFTTSRSRNSRHCDMRTTSNRKHITTVFESESFSGGSEAAVIRKGGTLREFASRAEPL
jgi:hypothetical protein